MSIVQHGERLFAVLYVYDDTAHTTWYVIPGGSWNAERTTFTGAAYWPHANYYPGQDGWGVAIMQQGATLHSFFFSYERFGNAAWWVSPGGRWLDARTYEGRVYRPVGSRWLDVPFESGKIWAADAGPFRLTFEDPDHVLLEFTILGTGTRYPLTRLQF